MQRLLSSSLLIPVSLTRMNKELAQGRAMPLGTEACECRHCIPLPHLVLANSEEAVKDITPHHFKEQHFHLTCKICSFLWILLCDSLQSCFTATQHLLLMSSLTKSIGGTFNVVETISCHQGVGTTCILPALLCSPVVVARWLPAVYRYGPCLGLTPSWCTG